MDDGKGGWESAPLRRAVLRVALHSQRPTSRTLGGLWRGALAACLSTVGLLVVMPTAAEAAFPGANGFIVFASSGFSSGRSCAGWHRQAQLFELAAAGSSAFQLTCTPGRDQHPFVSPDGSEVVFSNTGDDRVSQLFTLSLAPTRHHRLARPTLASDSPQASDDYASWSPAGDGTIVFQRSTSGGQSQLYFENVADPSTAAPVFPSATGFNDTEPVFDPSDPEVIAFVRVVGGQSHVFTYDVSTQVLTDLSAQGDGGTPGNDSKPDFAPAGAGGRIVFESDRACGYAQLYTMTLQGTDQTSVFPTSSHSTATGTESCSIGGDDPVYSPEGDQLAFDQRGYFSHGHEFAYAEGERTGSTRLSFVTVDSSGMATGAITGIKSYGFNGVQPSWGPSAGPPAQTPEVSLPIVLPVLGAAVTGTALLVGADAAVRRIPPQKDERTVSGSPAWAEQPNNGR